MAMAMDPFDLESTRFPADSWQASALPGPRPLPPIVLCLPTLFGAAAFTVTATPTPRGEVHRR